MRTTVLLLTATTLILGILQGCAPIILGGVATGASVAHDRRSGGSALDDQTIEFKALNILHTNTDLADHGSFSATSFNQVVLLTGQAKSESYRSKYAGLVGQISKVKRVVNEVQISPDAGISQQASDTWITTKAKTQLFKIKIPGFDPFRVKVVTESGVVYLMGLVTPQEADATVEKVRYLRGVKQVVKVFEYI
ncbi:BON domain-containing protein [Candidatus Vondammii sp. HM_W22]|uniref:BON domain-containing protein n=1 Tax=Candidatus Vondammii sp. HM_W22 TaxID=2687299 RepID=UPI001F12CA27|nr:BON domain-containing protein [Candidatus Vondammii sp. HM_W22]